VVIHLDSSFLIDLEREHRRGRPGGALHFIEGLDDDEVLAVSVHTVCELRAGAELAPNPLKATEALDELLGGLLLVYPDDRFAPLYARLLSSLQRSGRPVATMDLLIATAALLDDAPLVTRNARDFSRVPGLRVLEY
jgi:predicted nucleic acid-binding protein